MITKAVIPAAGRGTRLRPATASVPKEMLPVAGTPMIQLCLREAVEAGIREICIVLDPRRAMVRDYLRARPRPASLRVILRKCRLSFAWQEKPRGVADAVDCARAFVGDGPFAMMLPDNVVFARRPVIRQIEETFTHCGRDTFAVAKIPARRAASFSMSGRIEFEACGGRSVRITAFRRKGRGYCSRPAERHLVRTIARGIFLPHFFDYVDRVRKRLRGEIDDGPVVREIIRREGLMGHFIEGDVFDCGNPRGYAAANSWAVAHVEC